MTNARTSATDSVMDAPQTPVKSDFEVMRSRIHAAAVVAGVEADLAEQIAQPRRVIEMNLVVLMDDGRREIFPAWRVQHSFTRALTASKGGVKIALVPGADKNSPEAKAVMRDAVIALAAGMTIKTTVAGLPLGGAKGGIIADVHALSKSEKERLIRRYAADLAPDLGRPGHWVDVPAPDMGTSPEDMAIFADTISRLHGGFTPGVVTGKPVAIGGIPGRVEATGFGVAHLADQHQGLAGSRVAISGFGNVGSFAANTTVIRGGIVTAIHDPFLGGVLLGVDGIDIEALLDSLQTYGRGPKSFELFANTNEGVELVDGTLADFADKIDVYMPCAAPQSVDIYLAASLVEAGVSLVVEGANSPVQPEAVAVFEKAGVTVLPDVLANAGGVVCSFLEMSKAAGMTLPSKSETLERVGEILSTAYDRVVTYAAERNIGDLRLAADAMSVAEIAEAHHLRGIF